MKKILLLVFLNMFVFSFGFTQERYNDSIYNYIKILGDTIVKGSIELSEVVLLPRLKYKNSDDVRRYLILKRKTFKVYSYAVLASERLTTLNQRLSKIKRRRDKKKYTRIIQKFILNEFYDELSKFTQTEGQILIKLIHRQTGSTAYKLIKELRNGWSAFWYNNTARIFNMSLKRDFDPYLVKEDYLIEDIIQRAIRDKKLEYQKPKISYDLFELERKWR